jgi:hypothetical protein
MSKTIKLNEALYNKAERCAEAGGYSSVAEFVEHVLEKEIAQLENAESDQDIARKLRGLGYLKS